MKKIIVRLAILSAMVVCLFGCGYETDQTYFIVLTENPNEENIAITQNVSMNRDEDILWSADYVSSDSVFAFGGSCSNSYPSGHEVEFPPFPISIKRDAGKGECSMYVVRIRHNYNPSELDEFQRWAAEVFCGDKCTIDSLSTDEIERIKENSEYSCTLKEGESEGSVIVKSE